MSSTTTTTPKFDASVHYMHPVAEPLCNGDRLSRQEFHRRYEAYPEDVKIELIGGIVYMAAAQRRPHGRFQTKLAPVLDHYETNTPGVETGIDSSVFLDDENEPRPDSYLRVLEDFGGQSHVDEEEYIVGAPELLAEIAHSSIAIDLHKKKDSYQQTGVIEYIVVCVAEKVVRWFDLKRGDELPPDANNVIRSRVFPGLWLNVPALINKDSVALRATLDQGLASEEHAKFVEQLKRRKK